MSNANNNNAQNANNKPVKDSKKLLNDLLTGSIKEKIQALDEIVNRQDIHQELMSILKEQNIEDILHVIANFKNRTEYLINTKFSDNCNKFIEIIADHLSGNKIENIEYLNEKISEIEYKEFFDVHEKVQNILSVLSTVTVDSMMLIDEYLFEREDSSKIEDLLETENFLKVEDSPEIKNSLEMKNLSKEEDLYELKKEKLNIIKNINSILTNPNYSDVEKLENLDNYLNSTNENDTSTPVEILSSNLNDNDNLFYKFIIKILAALGFDYGDYTTNELVDKISTTLQNNLISNSFFKKEETDNESTAKAKQDKESLEHRL